MTDQFFGKSVRRKEGLGKVTGACKYIDDDVVPGCLHGVTVRSKCARGRIKKIEFTGNLPWHEFVIVTAKDIPGSNVVALILEDQPYLATHGHYFFLPRQGFGCSAITRSMN